MPKTKLFSAKNNQAKAGFTLIELLVVIAIIALLASVVFLGLNAARLKARNGTRVADARQLVTAFNLALTLNASSTLPDTAGGWACVATSCYGGWSSITPIAAVNNFLAPALAQLPTDPPDNGARGFGGFIYNNNWVAGTAWDGSVLPPGAYVSYLLETTDITACGSANFWWLYTNSVQCMLPIR